MKKTLWTSLLLLAFVGAFVMFGCSSNSTDNNTPTGPGAPTLNTPASGAVNVAVRPTAFSWSAGTNATGYTLHVATDAGFSNMVVNQDVAAATSFSAPNLSYNQVYYWEVEARDVDNNTTLSSHSSFTTIGRLIDLWDARDNWMDSLGIDQMHYTFGTDATYHWTYSAGQTSYSRSGGFTTTSTIVTFHETDNDGSPVDTTYSRDYAFTNSDSVLVLEYNDGSVIYNIQYDRVP
jgi:hypothetical protein